MYMQIILFIYILRKDRKYDIYTKKRARNVCVYT